MSNELIKVPGSKAQVRFPDCDPFNHLNNARYLDYFINAREDHIAEHYGLRMYEIAQKTGKSWVVASNQIAYLKPALLMEEVWIESQLIRFSEKDVQVEMRMWNMEKTQLKSLLWGNFVHIDVRTAKVEDHIPEHMQLFEQVVMPVPEKTFRDRMKTWSSSKSMERLG